ncbi:invasion associated locus B family protein [Roseiarcus sp.]|jgi:invasion protein IalB|uniref:invasion associated locus B family protein n=1 Tax=Roseiarcus sp. TaxID=1969460 RepID=UPI003C74F326
MASEFAGGGTRTRTAVRPSRAAAVGLVAVGLALANGGAAAAGDAASAWETRCETPPGAANEQCAVIQSVVDDQRPNITLVIIALKTADHKSRLLRVIAPLGALLPTGLDLKLDADDVGRMGFVRCLPNGCVAETLIDDKLLQRMESAQTMTFVLFQTPEEGIGVPAPMAGFKDAFDKLP